MPTRRAATWRHAYLLAGPEGVGRRTLATRFAQALNCTNPPEPGSFCGECRECRQIAALAHPDLSLLTPTEGHKDIRIDQVRGLQHTLALAPYAAKYRIALLPDFQLANTQASNALLKSPGRASGTRRHASDGGCTRTPPADDHLAL